MNANATQMKAVCRSIIRAHRAFDELDLEDDSRTVRELRKQVSQAAMQAVDLLQKLEQSTLFVKDAQP